MPKFKHTGFALLLILLFCAPVLGTTVKMTTNLGDITVRLFDDTAPVTVANFLKYVTDGDYTNTFIHRSVPGFIIQGGGFVIEGNTISYVPTDPSIVNEFFITNTRGTIALAKLGGDPRE